MTGDTARLFASLELPRAVRSALSEWALHVGAERLGLRPVPVDALHLTLCFLGAQPVGEIEAIGNACGEAVREPPIPIALGAARWLPARRPRVLAVDLDDAGGGLVRLQRALAERLASGCWYEPEHRSYLPHITVARAGRSGARVAARPEPLASPEPLSFTADSVALMRSHLGPGGSRYERLVSFELGDGT